MTTVFDTPLNTTDQSVDRLLSAGLPVALVFLDGQPSTDLAQAMDRLARQYAGQLLVAKIQVKDGTATMRRFQVGATPALVTQLFSALSDMPPSFATAAC